jgi:hypothetical protein
MEPLDIESTRARAESVRKYFTKTPNLPVYATAKSLATVAILCALPVLVMVGYSLREHDGWNSCFSCLSGIFIFATLSFALPSAISYTRTKQTYARDYHLAEPKPSDAQIDAWHAEDLERLKPHALSKLDLIEEQVHADNPKGPLVVVGSGPSPQVRIGRDGKVRFSSHEILIMYLTPYHLAAFKCVIDLHDGAIRTETTQEYHYDDVVSVSTQTDNSALTWYSEGQLRQSATHERFAVSVASGEQISVAVGFTASMDVDRNSKFDFSGAADAIRVIRARLREKKGGSTDRDSLL